jgi:S-adenosylmethionine-dependent methyltransferase
MSDSVPTPLADGQRFQRDAGKYASYLETPEGRLRLDLAFMNLLEFLPQDKHSLRALDLGCGTGKTAVRLARLGVEVTLLDSSPAMLDLAQRAAHEAGVAERITIKLGDAARVGDLLPSEAFDVILCHNLLEYVDDPDAVLDAVSRTMRDSSAILSLLLRNQAGEVLKAAIQAGNLAMAENNLGAHCGEESLYGGRVRLFTADSVSAMLNQASLTAFAERGVRVVADYLPSQLCRDSDYDQILELERKLGRRPEFAAIARYTHWFARRSSSRME